MTPVPKNVSYHVEPRPWAGNWAVYRRGPKGGKRHIAVYDTQAVALHIVACLNASKHREWV